MWNDIALLTVEDYSYTFFDQNPQAAGTGQGPEVRKIIRQAFEETFNGVLMAFDLVVVVGRKLD